MYKRQVDTREKLAQLKKVLESTQELNWDVETHSDYFKADGRIVSLSGTCEVKTKSGELKVWVFALPLYHPESPWKSSHRSVLKYLKSALEEIPKSVAHNGGYDSKWLLSYGINPVSYTHLDVYKRQIRSCDFVRHFRDDVYMAGRLGQFIASCLNVAIDDIILTMHIVNFHVFEGDVVFLKNQVSQSAYREAVRLSSCLLYTSRCV